MKSKALTMTLCLGSIATPLSASAGSVGYKAEIVAPCVINGLGVGKMIVDKQKPRLSTKKSDGGSSAVIYLNVEHLGYSLHITNPVIRDEYGVKSYQNKNDNAEWFVTSSELGWDQEPVTREGIKIDRVGKFVVDIDYKGEISEKAPVVLGEHLVSFTSTCIR